MFHEFFTGPASPSGTCMYGTLLLPLMLLMTTAKKKTLFAVIYVYMHGIVGFTEQQTVFMYAQSESDLCKVEFLICVYRAGVSIEGGYRR